jgi:hypothetical protein
VCLFFTSVFQFHQVPNIYPLCQLNRQTFRRLSLATHLLRKGGSTANPSPSVG